MLKNSQQQTTIGFQALFAAGLKPSFLKDDF